MAFDPTNPFQGGFQAGAANLVRNAAGQGYFDPSGNSAYRMGMRRRILAQGANRRRRGSVLARLAGLDGIGQQDAMVNNEQDIAGNQSDTLNNFDTNQYDQNQQYYRQLLGGQIGYDQNRQTLHDQQMADFYGGIGSLAGQVGMGGFTHWMNRRWPTQGGTY